jgi:hypothetical protein
VFELVLKEGVAVIAMGVTVGLVAAAVLSRVLGAFLFEVEEVLGRFLASCCVPVMGIVRLSVVFLGPSGACRDFQAYMSK